MSKKNGEYRISEAKIRRMHDADMTIGGTMKISISELRNLASTSTTAEIADMTEARYNTTWYRLKVFDVHPKTDRHDKRWTPAEDAEIIEGMLMGLKTRDIAKKLPGRNRDMVLGRWFRIKGGK